MKTADVHTIVVADDHRMFRETLVKYLASVPHLEVVADVSTATEALHAVELHAPTVLLTDISMPGGTGLDLIRTLERMDAATRSLVLTMHDAPAMGRAALDAGAWGYITKSASSEQLVEYIECVAGGRRLPAIGLLPMSGEGNPHAAHNIPHPPMSDDALRIELDAALSPRERQVLTLIAEGHTSKEIAGRLSLSPGTVDNYRMRVSKKLGVKGRAAMVQVALQAGLVSSATLETPVWPQA